MEKLTQWIIKFKWAIIAIVTGLTILLGSQIKHLTIDSDILSSLPDDDSTSVLYKQIGEQYNGNEIGMIVLESDNIFTTEILQHIKQITDSLKLAEGVSTVASLTDIIDIKSSEWGIEIGKLVDDYDLPDEKPELDSLKDYVFSKEMYKGAIVSEDGTATVIMFTLMDDSDKQAVANEVKAMVASLDLPETVYFGGLPFMLNDITDLIVADMVWLIPREIAFKSLLIIKLL